MATLEQSTTLREHLMANIQLADNKAKAIFENYKYVKGIERLYLDTVSPVTDTTDAPATYKIFEAVNDVDVAYECTVLKRILTAKYDNINKMLNLVEANYEERLRQKETLESRRGLLRF